MNSITRRSFLRTNGALVSLPFLHSLAGGAAGVAAGKSSVPSKKLILVYLPNGVVRRAFFPGEEEGERPGFVGGFNADKFKDKKRIQNLPGVYPLELTRTLKPLAPHAKDVTLITGLDRTYKNGQDVHAQAASCFLTSVSPEQAAERGWRYPNGRSLDHVIGDAVGKNSAFSTLEIGCNGFKAGKESIYFDNVSWYGPDKIAPSIKDPRKLYERLFLADGYRDHVGDVTDLVLADAKDLSGKLGREDRETMGEFMEMIRNVEVRTKKLERMLAGADVKVPKEEVLPRGEYIRLQADLMLLAMQMGLTNVATFMIGPERWDATLRYEGVFDKPVQHHNMTHNQKKPEVQAGVEKIDAFHVEQYAYLLSRMKVLKESDGSSMLDNSIVFYGAGLGDGATHQYFDLPVVVAGKAGGQIKQGRFVKCKSGTLNSNLWLTFAKLMGLEIDTFADSTGVLSDLWT